MTRYISNYIKSPSGRMRVGRANALTMRKSGVKFWTEPSYSWRSEILENLKKTIMLMKISAVFRFKSRLEVRIRAVVDQYINIFIKMNKKKLLRDNDQVKFVRLDLFKSLIWTANIEALTIIQKNRNTRCSSNELYECVLDNERIFGSVVCKDLKGSRIKQLVLKEMMCKPDSSADHYSKRDDNVRCDFFAGYFNYLQNKLILACSQRAIAEITSLMRFGADLYRPDSNGEYALGIAIYECDIKLVDFLEHEMGEESISPQYCIAMISNNLKIYGNAIYNQQYAESYYSYLQAKLILACHQGAIAEVISLMRFGADLYRPDSNGEYALGVAIYRCNRELVEFLEYKMGKLSKTPTYWKFMTDNNLDIYGCIILNMEANYSLDMKFFVLARLEIGEAKPIYVPNLEKAFQRLENLRQYLNDTLPWDGEVLQIVKGLAVIGAVLGSNIITRDLFLNADGIQADYSLNASLLFLMVEIPLATIVSHYTARRVGVPTLLEQFGIVHRDEEGRLNINISNRNIREAELQTLESLGL